MAASLRVNRYLHFSLLIAFSLYFGSACAQTGYVYQLDTEFAGANFFQGWDFFTSGDPTGGFVTYYGQSSALLTGLINAAANGPTYIGADYTNIIPVNGAGRPSVRISSQKSWTHGLFIGDFNHAPGGICGTWPAFWTIGPNWPYNGEIDILEGVNQLTQNAVSLHTNVTCTIAGDPNTETGILQGANCAYYPPGGNTQGCGVLDSRATSYGTGFNAAGGGVYAMQWTSDYIRVWVFLRDQIPADITNLTPDPSGWGLPAANMQGSCPIDVHFQQHKIIFDDTFCGSYAGVASVWNSTINSCATSTGYSTCNAFVAAVPSAFQNAYWSINSVRVYQLLANGANSSTTPYIASLQPTSSSASSASTTPAPTPTASYCPTYNFTVIQAGAYQYEIECGYNPAGPDLGPPYASYQVHTFEDCVAGCSYWNTYNSSNICGAVTYSSGGACYWKRQTGTIAKDPTFNGARLIYYAYPQVTDNPNAAYASSTATTTFAQTPVTPQTYRNPTAIQSQSSLVSASGASSVVGVGMGGSVSNTFTTSASSSSGQSSSSSVSSSSAITTPISTTSSAPATSTMASTTIAQIMTSTSTHGILSTISAGGTNSSLSSSAAVVTSSSSTTPVLQTTSVATSSLILSSTLSVSGSSSMLFSNPPTSATSSLTTTASSSLGPSSLSSTQTSASPPLSTSVVTTLPPPLSASTTMETTPNNGIPSGGNGDATETAAPTEVVTPTARPATVDGFRYGGCQGSSSSLTNFREVEDSPVMSIEQCISDCYDSAYAGIYTTTCYCGDKIDATDSLTSFPDAECNAACPGSPTEICGGIISGQNGAVKRQGSSTGGTTEILLTIYENEILVPDHSGSVPTDSTSTLSTTTQPSVLISETTTPASPPASTSPEANSATTSSSTSSIIPPSSTSAFLTTTTSSYSLSSVTPTQSATPDSSSSTTGTFGIGFDPGAGNGGLNIAGGSATSPGSTLMTPPPSSNYPPLIPFTVSTVWIEVCDACEHGTTELATTVTVLHCGCTQSVDMVGNTVTVPPPRVPMTVTVEECGCGEGGASASTTLAVPCSSAIAEASSSVAAAMAVWMTQLGTQCPTPIPWLGQAIAVVATGAAGQQPAQTPGIGIEGTTATPAKSADVPEMTNSIAPAAGIHAANNGTVMPGTLPPVLTQTVTLESTHSTTSPPVVEGSKVVAPPLPLAVATTKKSAAAERPKFAASVGAALVGIFVAFSLLEPGW